MNIAAFNLDYSPVTASGFVNTRSTRNSAGSIEACNPIGTIANGSTCVSGSATIRTTCTTDSVLEVRGLGYHYGDSSRGKAALNQVDFALQPGQFHVLLGPNGAGKSTLFALLTRLLVAQSGSIELFGRDLVKSPANVLADIGVVFQQSTLDLDLTVEQNLIYQGSLHGLSPALVRERMAIESARFGLSERLKDRVRQLNGGHRRRLEIVRALLHEPCLLLLDEPTSGLDLDSRQYLNERVRQLCRERGLCVLWATHLMEEVQDPDDVILLHEGRITVQGRCRKLCYHFGCHTITEVFRQLTGGDL